MPDTGVERRRMVRRQVGRRGVSDGRDPRAARAHLPDPESAAPAAVDHRRGPGDPDRLARAPLSEDLQNVVDFRQARSSSQ